MCIRDRYEKDRAEREALHRLKEEMSKKARREARIKKMKEEHGTTRWRAKRKVASHLHCACLPILL